MVISSKGEVAWEKPVKNLEDAIKRLDAGCKTLQFESRLDPYSDGSVNFTRAAGDKIVNLHLGDAGVGELCKALKTNKTCRALDLSGNKISSEGIGHITELLKSNKNIEILYLEDNNLVDEDVDELAKFLAKNTTLKQLALSGNKISDDGATNLAHALSKNKESGLQSLWLNRNEIRDVGAKSFGHLLTKKNNKNLRELCLEENHIRERGAKVLAKGLVKNKTLKVLDLGGNKIGPKGAKYFNDALIKIAKDKNKIKQKKSKKPGENGDEEIAQKEEVVEWGQRKGEVELVLAGNRFNEEDYELLRAKGEDLVLLANNERKLKGKDPKIGGPAVPVSRVNLVGRANYDDKPKDKMKRRVINYLKYHMFDNKYAGHFDSEKDVQRVL